MKKYKLTVKANLENEQLDIIINAIEDIFVEHGVKSKIKLDVKGDTKSPGTKK